MDSLRNSAAINQKAKSFGLESSEEVEYELNVALEEIARLGESYRKISIFHNSIAALECADYTKIIHQSANLIINRTIKTAKLEPLETSAVESMSFSMSGIIDSVKNTASNVWSKIREWFNKLLSLLERFMIKYRDGFMHIGNHIAVIGNALVKGSLKEVVKSIDTNSLEYNVGAISLTGNNIAEDFFDFESRYDELVEDPIKESYDEIKNLMSEVVSRGFNQKSYKIALNRAVRKSIKNFTKAPPKTTVSLNVQSTDRYTNNIFAGAYLKASIVKSTDIVALSVDETSLEYNFNMLVEGAPVPQLVTPLNSRHMLRLASKIKDSSNPWISNKDGLKYVNYGKELIKLLSIVNEAFPDEKSIETIYSVLITYNNCILKLNTEMQKVYKHAVLTIYNLVKASVYKP